LVSEIPAGDGKMADLFYSVVRVGIAVGANNAGQIYHHKMNIKRQMLRVFHL
jgi:hypothetical protein